MLLKLSSEEGKEKARVANNHFSASTHLSSITFDIDK